MPAKKKTKEPEIPVMNDLDETLLPAEQPDKPETDDDINELLANMDMDADPEDMEYQDGIEDDAAEFDNLSGGNEGEEEFGNTETPEDNSKENILGGESGEPGIPDPDGGDSPTLGKPKRAARKKKEPDTEFDSESAGNTLLSDTLTETPVKPAVRRRSAAVLTIDSKAEVTSQKNIEEAAWHEIRNAYRTRKILTGTLGGIEQTETGKTIAIVHYNEYRVVIPVKEMMLNITRRPSGTEYDEFMRRQNKILSNMLGAEIDFIVKGIDSKMRSIVASRKDAMLKKREIFYMHTDAAGTHRIYEGRVVQARVIAVAEKVIRIEAFGVECSILARELSWDWLSDAHERFSIGDEVLVRILSVQRNSVEDISITADIRSTSDITNYDNLKKCRIQGKYAGTVTDNIRGVVYIRLTNGANAIAHSCYDRRTPGKKDDVSFAVTHIDEERGYAIGIITRILKQNL